MIQGFENLTEQEFNVLTDAIAQIAVLIAGADGNIDQEEKEWAVKIADIRGYSKQSKSLNGFYDSIEADLLKNIEELSKSLPSAVEEREQILSEKLTSVNEVLPKLNNQLGHQLYQSYVSYADHIAEASGGFMRFGSVSKSERKWLSLPMIQPIELIVEN